MLATACRTVRDKVCGRRTEFDSTASTALAWRVASDMPARRCCDSAEARVREREAKPDERDARRRRAGGAARESADLVAAGNRRRTVPADLDRLGGGHRDRLGAAGCPPCPPAHP